MHHCNQRSEIPIAILGILIIGLAVTRIWLYGAD